MLCGKHAADMTAEESIQWKLFTGIQHSVGAVNVLLSLLPAMRMIATMTVPIQRRIFWNICEFFFGGCILSSEHQLFVFCISQQLTFLVLK